MWTRSSLSQVVYLAPAVYFVLKQPLNESSFRHLDRYFTAASGVPIVDRTWQQHWEGLRARMSGRSRWDTVVGAYSERPSASERLQRWQSFPNIIQHRPYTAYKLEGIEYTVDVFNPANELDMPYAGAGETVVALLLHSEPPYVTQDQLATNEPFHSTVRAFADILQPEYVCGAYSIYNVLCAYNERKLDPTTRPWDLSFQLMVLNKPQRLPSRATPTSPLTTNDSIALLWPVFQSPRFAKAPVARLFKRVDVWDEDHVLVQISEGFDMKIANRYVEAARVLGKIAIQELAEL